MIFHIILFHFVIPYSYFTRGKIYYFNNYIICQTVRNLVEQVRAAGGKICLALITLGNIYIFLCWPQRRQCKMETETPLWSRDINFDSADIDNKTGTPDGSYLVPNHIHYIRFGRRRFTYTEMVCVLAAFKNQKPEKILFHRDHNQTFSGPYWDVLSRLKPFMDIVEFKYAPLPDQIFGQPIDQQVRKYHGSDITRIRILMEQGGIFLDNDVYVVKTLDEFRRYEMTLNWDRNQYLGTQVLLAHKDARFLRLWLDSYRGAYRGDIWYYNAGERPTETILLRRPELVHRVKVKFGADTGFIEKLFQRIWPGWRKMYALHLLINHQYLLSNLSRRATFPVVFNEKNIAHYPITFRDMAYDVYEIGRIMWAKKYKDD